MEIQFTKMQACGNDYIYIDCMEKDLTLTSKQVTYLSNRNFGIGGDGVILIQKSKKADFKMKMYNSNGSCSGMCGNGLRSMAKFLYVYQKTKKSNFTIETGQKIVQAVLHFNPKKEVEEVSINMGKPLLKPEEIPILYKKDLEKIIEQPLEIEKQIFYITTVNMGNPHVVLFVDDVNHFDVCKIGSLIENHSFFPEKTNINFVSVLGKNLLRQRTWERGAGETLACGSGACSVLVASCLTRRTDRKVKINLRGGNLTIEWLENNEILMKGKAEIVFEGRIKIS